MAGVTEHCDFPVQAQTKAKVGAFGRPVLSKILALKPGLVLADAVLHKNIADELRNAGIKVIAFTPESVSDIFFIMNEIARFCGVEAAVRPVIDLLKKRAERLNRKPGHKRPRVFRLMNADPLMTPGPGSFQYDALQTAGAQLMVFQTKDPYIEVLPEQILEFDPEVVLFCGVAKGQPPPPKCKGCIAEKLICRRTVDDIRSKEWEQITAFRENRVYPVSCHTICRPGPRLIDGMEKLHHRFFKLFMQ
ncbi:MAG: ABC-type Fe3+-hydroxamate transport system, periplasmic component [Pelotomaculum thermopropionicum]|uniref:ABC-type Fe3+-hydroxamate transport system, periplasmic component n=1 Tax=Pelotomaculum thermopropionicum TaxID=110500 RepID=A0A117M3D3_9FIRM|nr:MAG: ABC-type Fe3+-hydroxamate transport system, periplasmic component [Pelotomaculum thermopropionicum]